MESSDSDSASNAEIESEQIEDGGSDDDLDVRAHVMMQSPHFHYRILLPTPFIV